MDFGVRGITTPYAQHRQAPGSARRPQSARQGRNPITGEEYEPAPTVSQNVNNHNSTATQLRNRPPSRPSSKPDDVPSLNLNYLQDNEEKSGAISISLRDYKLDSPSANSTVSWGTGRSGLTLIEEPKPQAPSARQNNVPDLLLGTPQRPPSARRIKQPTAWDRDPVPEDVPAPSARHQQMYKQYADEMRQAYRTHADPTKVSEEEIQRTMQAMRKKGQQAYSARNVEENGGDEDGEDVGEDVVDERWKKQRYTSNQLRKKLDAEELLEHNKKLKLLETVMIDQLSRAVISDPEQDQRNNVHGGSTTRRVARGTNRYLHDSKVSTRSTATENLLSRRVRFGARIITRNGRDAVRELTGFFFQVDRSMTVYEFKQFGKSAKAIPFIQRGQQALSAELARFKYLTLRVTDVDEEEKAVLLSEEEDEYTARSDGPSQMDRENRHFLQVVQETAQAQISKRGIKTITGLGRHYRQLDKDGTGMLLQHDLERGLLRFHIDIPPQVLEQVFDIIDPDGERRVDYSVFMRTVLGEMNEFRKSLVRKAFCKVDTHRQGSIHLSNIRKFFNANCPYQPGSDADSTKSALQAFLDEVRTSPKQEEVSYIEFEEYYEGLSLGVKNDEEFANILRNTWNI